jgi:hypothetical protein
MAAHFGQSNVFMDVDTVRPGADFVEAIDRAIASSGAVVAVIDPQWATDGTGRNRIADEGDYVSLEIRTALEGGVPVIPVLVLGAQMPQRDQLPLDLQPLARRQAVVLSHERFTTDVLPLERELSALLGTSKPTKAEPDRAEPAVARPAVAEPARAKPVAPASRQKEKPRGRGKRVLAVAAVLLAIVAAVIVINNWPNPTPQPGELGIDSWEHVDDMVVVNVSNRGDGRVGGTVRCEGTDPTGPFTLRIGFDDVPPGGAAGASEAVFHESEVHDCWLE